MPPERRLIYELINSRLLARNRRMVGCRGRHAGWQGSGWRIAKRKGTKGENGFYSEFDTVLLLLRH